MCVETKVVFIGIELEVQQTNKMFEKNWFTEIVAREKFSEIKKWICDGLIQFSVRRNEWNLDSLIRLWKLQSLPYGVAYIFRTLSLRTKKLLIGKVGVSWNCPFTS